MPKNPHANFSPVLDGYTGQGAFRFWCQMALPLTYDDSLSYYELLNKVVTYLNNTISDVSAVETNVGRLSEAYNQLQDYVNDYFDELDVEEELRNVLDKMALDGSLDAILTPLVEEALPDIVDDKIGAVVADQIGDVVAEQITGVVENQLPPLVDENVPDAVTEWLDNNVEPVGSAVLVDNTLSISGAAADAKVTGDEITALNTQLNEHGIFIDVTKYPAKYIEPSTGNFRDGTNYTVIRCPVLGLQTVTIIPYVTSQYMGYAFRNRQGYTVGTNYGGFESVGENTITVPDNAYFIDYTSNNATNEAEIHADWSDLVVKNVQFNDVENHVSKLLNDDVIEMFGSIGHADMDTTQTGLLLRTGRVIDNANQYLSDYIECTPGTSMYYLMAYLYGVDYIAIGFYDINKVFIDNSGVTAASGTSGTWAKAEGIVTVPVGAKYFRFVMSKITRANVNAEDQVIRYTENKTVKSCVEEIRNMNISGFIGYTDMDVTKTGIIANTGAMTENNNLLISDAIPCVPGTELSYKLCYIYGDYVALAFYQADKTTFVSGVTADSGTSGSWAKAEGTAQVPNNARFFRFTMIKGTTQIMNSKDQTVIYAVDNTIKEAVSGIINRGSYHQWEGKKWCAFGTSITDTSYIDQGTGEVTGKYVPFLAKSAGLIVTNRGIAGGTIGSNGIHGGSSTILNAILNSDDLDAFDLITIEGFVNDYAAAVSIGEIGDTENTTMYGALYQAITYILQNSHAEVVLITETTGREYTVEGATVNYNVLRKNSLNLYQQDYNNVIIKIGQMYGVHVIDAGGKSQINQYHPEYITDQIHHTTLGGEQYANTIWEELKNIHPATVT